MTTQTFSEHTSTFNAAIAEESSAFDDASLVVVTNDLSKDAVKADPEAIVHSNKKATLTAPQKYDMMLFD
jgi:hypothetical protein